MDEVQDSDRSQLEFLEALKGTETKIFAVGDPNQVIYSFRGTTQNMFFLLKSRFQAKELSLPVNYLSNTSILEAANRFLQFGGKIQGSNGSGEKIRVKNHYDPFQEAMYLADRIQKLHAEGKRYQDIAVFYRLQRQAEVLEKMFGEQGIPYEVSVKKSWKDIPVLNWALLGSIENSGKERESEANDGTVKLMTLHASKGLEFDTVFIIGVNPGLLPIRCSNFDQEEEERRLFFVGITRAKNHLELSYYTNPGEPGVLGTYSNYLKMIPEDLLEMEDVRSEEEKRTNLKVLARQARAEIRKNEEDSKACNGIEKTEKKETTESEQSDSERSESGINKEQEAKHPKYGTGIVTSEDDMMIEVDFPNYGKKQFIKAFQEVELI